MKKYTGSIYWYEGNYRDYIVETLEPVRIKRGILNDGVFRLTYDVDNISTQINLRSKDGFLFQGSSKQMDENHFSGNIDMYFYSNNLKALLIGKWMEEGELTSLIIELDEVKEFDDQV